MKIMREESITAGTQLAVMEAVSNYEVGNILTVGFVFSSGRILVEESDCFDSGEVFMSDFLSGKIQKIN